MNENEIRRFKPIFIPCREGRAVASHELLSSSHCFWLKIERSAYKGLRARIDVCCSSLSLPATILTKNFKSWKEGFVYECQK
jgi:hypothetical protein